MRNITNLAGIIRDGLPPDLADFLRAAGLLADSRKMGLYLVGGIVRDLLLERPNLDLDLVVVGDAPELARAIREAYRGRVVVHQQFGTATVKWDSMTVNLATARSETYERPGALPTVLPGDIGSDLFRRDFTINAMAVRLNSPAFGELLDLYDGRIDLDLGVIRVLHDKSFVDDATRIWRAIRYEKRLDFHIEPVTLGLIERDLPMLATISGDRIRHELERVLAEELPEKALRRADEIGVLARLHPMLRGDLWLAEVFARARELASPSPPALHLYLALLAYRLDRGQTDELVSYLKLPAVIARALRDTVALKENAGLLEAKLAPSRVYAILHGYHETALEAVRLAAESDAVRRQIEDYLARLRHVTPMLSGEDLKQMGVAQGPRIGRILKALHQARLDGKVASKEDEIKLARRLIAAGRERAG